MARGKGPQNGGNRPGQGSAGDPLSGRKTAPMGVARTERVDGIHRQGPNVKQVFLDAARRGFARKGWRKVYADYSEVAEEMLDKERLPMGRKEMVRRYFELIRPRR